MIIESVVIISAIAACSIGRHIQGGAGRRLWAMLLYPVALIPAAWLYAPDWWYGTALFVVMAGCLYAHMTFKEAFGNLWLALPRYGFAYVVLAVATGTWFVLACIPVVWLAMKWAKSDHDYVDDEHQIFEYIHGGVAGFAWSASVLL